MINFENLSTMFFFQDCWQHNENNASNGCSHMPINIYIYLEIKRIKAVVPLDLNLELNQSHDV